MPPLLRFFATPLSVHLYRPAIAQGWKNGKKNVGTSVGVMTFFFALHRVLVENIACGRQAKETSEKGRWGKTVKNH